MGGAIRVPGNKNRVAEFNIFADARTTADIVPSLPISEKYRKCFPEIQNYERGDYAAHFLVKKLRLR